VFLDLIIVVVFENVASDSDKNASGISGSRRTFPQFLQMVVSTDNDNILPRKSDQCSVFIVYVFLS
jgi:hypothetical protein